MRAGAGPLRLGGIGLAVLLAWIAGAVRAAPPPSDAAVRAAIEARLEALDDLGGAEIRVRVQDGRVLLQGRVQLLDQSLQAERAAWTTPGVVDLDNELRVVVSGLERDSTIERQVRMVLEADGRLLGTDPEVQVASGVVRLRATFQNPADVLTLKHRIARIAGVVDVQIDAVLLAMAPPGELSKPAPQSGGLS